MSTAYVSLGEVAAFVRGITFKPEDVGPVGAPGAVACMRTSNVQSELDLSDVWGVHSSLVRRDDQFLRQGDILVSSANSWNLVGKCCWVPELPGRATFGGFVSVLRADQQRVDPRFLFRWFASTRIQTIVRSFGQKTTSISNLNLERCRNLPLPLPPLAEQIRIAAVLDRADALRAKRRAALAQLDALTQSIFLDMFGDLVSNEKGFPVSRMGSVCDVRDGTHDSPKYVSGGGYPLVTSKNLRSGVVDLTDANFISEADYIQVNKRSKVDRGDILMPMIGTIGSPVLVDREPCYAVKNVALIKFTKTSPSAVYVRHLLSGNYFDHITSKTSRGGTQKFVSLGDLRSLPLPLPPITLQHSFDHHVAAVGQLKALILASLGQFDALFASLQHRAFLGEL